MIRYIFLSLFAFITILCVVTITNAQPVHVCSSYDNLMTTIYDKYNEIPIFIGDNGATDDDQVVYIHTYANPETGTWSIIIGPSNPTKPWCLMYAGKNYMKIVPHKPLADPSS